MGVLLLIRNKPDRADIFVKFLRFLVPEQEYVRLFETLAETFRRHGYMKEVQNKISTAFGGINYACMLSV